MKKVFESFEALDTALLHNSVKDGEEVEVILKPADFEEFPWLGGPEVRICMKIILEGIYLDEASLKKPCFKDEEDQFEWDDDLPPYIPPQQVPKDAPAPFLH